VLKTLGPTMRQVLVVEGRRARVRRHSVPLGQPDQATYALTLWRLMPLSRTMPLTLFPEATKGLRRFEKRLFRDTPLVYDALTVPSLTGIPNRNSNLSPGPAYPGPVPP
jgi:hypothetical protein